MPTSSSSKETRPSNLPPHRMPLLPTHGSCLPRFSLSLRHVKKETDYADTNPSRSHTIFAVRKAAGHINSMTLRSTCLVLGR